jgi:dipeptidyl aminopeptidase/acylaminoacyl peptidase
VCLLLPTWLLLFPTSVLSQSLESARSRERISFDDVLNRAPRSASRVRWAGSDLALEMGQGENAEIARLSVGRSAIEPIGKGQLLSVSPNGRSAVALLSSQWVAYDLQGGAVKQLRVRLSEKAGFQVHAPAPPEWSFDGRYLAIAEVAWYRYDPHLAESIQEVDGVRVIDVGANIDSVIRVATTIKILDMHRGSELHAQFEIPGTYSGMGWGNKGDLYVARKFDGEYGVAQRADNDTTVFRIDAEDKVVKEVFRTPGRMPRARPTISNDGRWMALAIDVDNRVWSDFPSLVTVDLTTGKAARLTHTQYIEHAYAWRPGTHEMYFTARAGAFDQLLSASHAAGVSQIAGGERRHFDIALSNDGKKISYQTIDGLGRRDIRVRDLVSGEERIVWVLDDPTKDFALGRVEQVQWPNGEGSHIYGVLVYPPNFDPSRKHPLFVNVHGGGAGSRLPLDGPFMISLGGGPLEWHALAALGYIVFCPDYRSNGQYGPAIAARRLKSDDPTGIAADNRDVETGVAYILSRPGIDSENVAIFGHSAGGQRTNVLLTRSKLFKAAVLNDPVPAGTLEVLLSYWTSGSHTGSNFEPLFVPTIGGRLQDKPQLYARSFLLDGYKNKTPTLILIGAKSPVPPLSSETLFTMLRQYRTPTRLIRFVDEGHTYTTVASARLAFREVTSWLDLHLSSQHIRQTATSQSVH